MTPLQVEILLHYHCKADDFRQGDFDAPAVRAAIDWFKGPVARLLEPTLRGPGVYTAYTLTDRGEAYIAHLLSIPLPRCVWIIPTGATPSAPNPVDAGHQMNPNGGAS